MQLDENSGSPISLEEAKIYVEAFRKKYPEEVKAFYIGRNQIKKILDQENCIGVRMYNGYDEVEKRLNIVIVGVDSAEKDMTGGIILDKTMPCPSYCDVTSALMM
jgi:hypothetical protein